MSLPFFSLFSLFSSLALEVNPTIPSKRMVIRIPNTFNLNLNLNLSLKRSLSTTLSPHATTTPTATSPPPPPSCFTHSISQEDEDSSLYPSWDDLSSSLDNNWNFPPATPTWLPQHLLLTVDDDLDIDDNDFSTHLARPPWLDIFTPPTLASPHATAYDTENERVLSRGDTKPKSKQTLSFNPRLHHAKSPSKSLAIALSLEQDQDSVSPIKPFRPTFTPSSTLPPQPHEHPLLSRFDWRLSAPLSPPRWHPQQPPSLSSLIPSSRGLGTSGKNKLIGVGLETYFESRRWRDSKDETWGWKLKVPAGEVGEWLSCDEWKKKSVPPHATLSHPLD